MEENMSCFVLAFVATLLVHVVCEVQILEVDNECKDGYKIFQESCYRLSNTMSTRLDAAAACMPGHLIDITSEEEQYFIAGILTENGIDGAWFGLLKSLSWSDGSPLVHESWQNIRANEGHQCFRLERNNNYLWNDNNCDEPYSSIFSDSEECRPDFKKFQRSCYQINNTTMTRSNAKATCGTSHLVDITSIKENDFVVGLLRETDIGDAWFGLTLSDPPSWSDGSLLTSASWNNITTDGNSVCYRLEDRGSAVYFWNDASSCRDKYRYVCEYEVTSLSSTNNIPEYTTPSTNMLSMSTLDMTAAMSTRTITNTTTNPTYFDQTGIPARSQTGVVIGLSLGIVVVVIILLSTVAIAIICYHRKSTTEMRENNLACLKTPTTTQPLNQDPKQVPDYQNVSNPKELKFNDDYLSLDVNSLSKKDAGYQSLNDNAMIGNRKTNQDVIYLEILDNAADQ